MVKFMQGKTACIALLVVILLISLADVILRATIFGEIASSIQNYGEVLITAAFAALLIIFLLAKKDRVFYILCGAWFGYFVLNQLFSLPGMINSFFATIVKMESFTDFALLIHVLSMVTIIIIGALLVEYMNDGTIYNKAFNALCAATIIMFLVNIVFHIYDIVVLNDTTILLAVLNNLSRMSMILLFVAYAYDSAKKQLGKVKF